MRRSSSTWLFSLGVLLGAAGIAAARGPRACLPGIFDGGRRLLESQAAEPLWLEPMIRQHEVCWRPPEHADEMRVFLYGNSGMFGLGMWPEQTVAAALDRHWAATPLHAHAFNLAFVTTHVVKDALIIHETRRFDPDVIVYALTLADFEHIVSVAAADTEDAWQRLVYLMQVNSGAMLAFADEHPAGLADALELYRPYLEAPAARWGTPAYWRLRHAGRLVRSAVQHHADALRAALGGRPTRPAFVGHRAPKAYDCAETSRAAAFRFADFQSWNPLAWLEQVRRESGLPVVIVNWPTARQPIGDCYNARYTNALVAEFDAWLEAEATRRALVYLDLSDALAADEFLDSIHPTAKGHVAVGAALAPALDAILRDLAAGRAGSTRALTAP